MNQHKPNSLTFQEVVLRLQAFWAERGCVLQQPYDVEVGAGTMAPETFLRVLGPKRYKVAYVQPSRRPADGRYGENPNRLFKHMILKPPPENVQELYLESLGTIGIDLRQHDIKFEEDNWEAPTLSAWGVGWQVMLDGLEITQFTYFQQCGGLDLFPISVELTYGLERIAAFLQDVDACDQNRIGRLLNQPHQRQLQRADGVHSEQRRSKMIRHEIIVEIGLHDHQNARGSERNRVRQLIAQHRQVKSAPESREARLQVTEQHDGLDYAMQNRGREQRAQGSEEQDRSDEDQRARRLNSNDERRSQPNLIVRHRDHVEECSRDPKQNRDADPRRIRRELSATENGRQNRGVQNQCPAGQRPHRNMEQHNVQNSFAAARWFARQEIERAHGDAQRKHDHGRRDHQKDLLVQPVLLAVQAANQEQR